MPDTLPVEFTHEEAAFIYQTYDQIPIQGSAQKRIAVNVQEKLQALDYSAAKPDAT